MMEFGQALKIGGIAVALIQDADSGFQLVGDFFQPFGGRSGGIS